MDDVERNDRESPTLLGQLAALTGLALLVALAFGSVSRTHRQRRTARPKPLPEKLQVWEGEGGQTAMVDEPA